MTTATFTNGNKEVTVSIKGTKEWTKDGAKRVYFDLDCTGKRQPIAKLYEVIEGNSRDKTLNVNGRTFAYEYGIDANSNTKRADVDSAVAELVAKL